MHISTKPTPRRRAALAAGVAAVLALAACGGDDDDAGGDPVPEESAPADSASDGTDATVAGSAPDGTDAAPDDDSAAAGTLVVALDRDPGHLDPYHVENHAARSISQAVFDTLVMDYDGEYVPTLAESLEIVDDTTIEFTLRDGVTFHNGEEFNAEAVKYNVERMLDPEIASHYLPQFEAIESAEVVDDLTVVLHLTAPDANMLDTLTHLFMVPPAYAEEVGTEGMEQAPVGTGPFTFVSYTADDRTVVEANPDYWEGSPKGTPEVATVEFRAIPEETTRIAELTSGNVDIAFRLSPDQIGTVESGGAEIVTYSDLSMEFIQINTASVGTVAEAASGQEAASFEALADPRVRTALNLAIDRQAIVDELFGGLAAPIGQPFAPGGFLTPSDPMLFDYDPDQARALLAEAGYGDGLTLQFLSNTSQSSDLMSLLASYFAEVGVTIEIEAIEAATFNDGWVAGQFPHLRYVTWSTPEQVLELLLETGDLISAYSNPDVDALLAEQAAQADPDERKATIEELAGLVHDDAAWVYLWAQQALVGVGPDVGGWSPHVSHVPVTGVSVTG